MLYLGAASGSSVSHVSDIVGPEGIVYAVEFSHRSGRDLIGMAKKRTNVIRECAYLPSALLPIFSSICCVLTFLLYVADFSPTCPFPSARPAPLSPCSLRPLFTLLPPAIVEDARHPQKYRMLIQMVDVIFADVAQPDQARIICLNAHHFLKNGGAIVISIKANCIDSTAPAAQVFASEVNNMRKEGIKPKGKLIS